MLVKPTNSKIHKYHHQWKQLTKYQYQENDHNLQDKSGTEISVSENKET